MVSQLLVAYVRDRLSHGYSAAETRQLFMNRGWRSTDVDAAIQVAQGNRPPSQAAQPSQPAFSNRPAQPSQPYAPAPSRQPARERTLMNAPSYSVSIDTGRLMQVLGGLVGMLVLVGIAYILFFQNPSSTRFELKVMSGEKALDGAEVRAYDEGKLVGTAKTVQGVAVFTNLPPKVLTFKISKPGYGDLEENYDTSASGVTTTEMLAVNATATNQTANATATPTATPVVLPAPLISGVSVNATNASAVIKWATNTPTNSTVLYGQSTAYGASAGSAESASAHAVTLSNLTSNKTYYYKIVGCTVSGGKANCASSPGSFLTFVQAAAPTCGGTSIGMCIPGTSDQCIADQFAGAVPYPMCSLCGCPSGTCTAAGTCATATATPTATPTPGPSCTVGGACGTTNCPAGYSGYCTQTYSSSCACQACTPSCTMLAPTISSVAVGTITDTGAIITWTTSANSNSTVYYGTTAAYGSATPVSDNVTSHSVPLGSLSTGTLYHFKVSSCNSAGCTNSSDGTFTTTGASALNYISISPMAPNTNITNGSQIQFTSIAYYSNGSTPSVTASAAWMLNPGSSGLISAGTFIANQNTGQETVTVSFGGKSNSTTLLVQKQVYTYLTLSPSSSVLWNSGPTTASCTASEGQTPVLTRNGAVVSSPDTASLAAGSYSYACSFAQTQSYLGHMNSSTLTVVPKPVSCSISLVPASGANGTSVTATASANESATVALSAPAWCPVVGTGCTGSADNSTAASFTASVAAGNYSGCSNSTSFMFT